MRRKTQSYTLENEVIEAVEKKANEDRRSKSQTVNEILRAFFENLKITYKKENSK